MSEVMERRGRSCTKEVVFMVACGNGTIVQSACYIFIFAHSLSESPA